MLIDIIKNFFKKKEKCIFCNKKGNLEYVPSYYIFISQDYGDFYHLECLNKIKESPETFTPEQIDVALDLIKRIDKWDKEKQSKLQNYYAKCDELKRVGKIQPKVQPTLNINNIQTDMIDHIWNIKGENK